MTPAAKTWLWRSAAISRKWQYKYLDEELNEQVSFFSNLATPRQQILGESQKARTTFSR